MRKWAWLGIALGLVGSAANGADKATLKALQAPPPAATRQLPEDVAARPIKLSRVVVELRPEPWAYVLVNNHGELGRLVLGDERLVTWKNGEQEVRTSAVSNIFNEEMRRAGGHSDSSSDSLFSDGSDTDLQIGVKVSAMAGRFCRYCGWGTADRWVGAVTMTARWEIYSSLERKTVATIDTSGGFAVGKPGLDGDPDRLINEAFRDNIRRLIASDEFRRVVTTPLAGAKVAPSTLPPIALHRAAATHTIGNATKSVAIIFAGDGSGSGFLISDDGYLLTNQHVVGGSKYVKVKWPDGAEALGEVVRSNGRRDVALVKVEAQGRDALALRLAPVQQGEPVFVIGSPLGEDLQNTMTKGIVSALRMQQGLPIIQSDAAVTHGNSGGPMLDEKGQVVAMTVSMRAPEGTPIGLNFFIPIDDALRALSLTPAPAAAPAPAAKSEAVAAAPTRAHTGRKP